MIEDFLSEIFHVHEQLATRGKPFFVALAPPNG
jgi:hypothetical protein